MGRRPGSWGSRVWRGRLAGGLVGHSPWRRAGAGVGGALPRRRRPRYSWLPLPHYPNEAEARRDISARLADELAQRGPRAPGAGDLLDQLPGGPVLHPCWLAWPPWPRRIPGEVVADGVLHTWPSFVRTLKRYLLQHRLDVAARAVGARASHGLPVQLLHGADRTATPAVRAPADGDDRPRSGRDRRGGPTVVHPPASVSFPDRLVDRLAPLPAASKATRIPRASGAASP